MNVYIQQKMNYNATAVFGSSLEDFPLNGFDELPIGSNATTATKSIQELIDSDDTGKTESKGKDRPDTFQPIIDFPNFLLIVLKLTLMRYEDFQPAAFILDDKELIHEFTKQKGRIDATFVKLFGYNLLKAKFLLDNYIVHHSNEDDNIESNPWKLQYWQKEDKGYLKNLAENNDLQDDLVQLLSMFEVSFTARQRKNYLFYCLFFLFKYGFADLLEVPGLPTVVSEEVHERRLSCC